MGARRNVKPFLPTSGNIDQNAEIGKRSSDLIVAIRPGQDMGAWSKHGRLINWRKPAPITLVYVHVSKTQLPKRMRVWRRQIWLEPIIGKAIYVIQRQTANYHM